MPIHGRECGSCREEYEVLSIAGEYFPIDGESLACPWCGAAEFAELAGAPTGVDLGTDAGVGRSYPYWDRVLQATVESAEHREVLLEARGWEATEGEFDAADVESRQQTLRDEFEAEYAADQDRMLNGPNGARNRKALDIIEQEGDKLWEDA